MIKPIVIAYTDQFSYAGVQRLIRTAQAWGWELHVTTGRWRGFGYRLKSALNQAAELKVMGYTHLLSIDAFDTIAVGPPSELPGALGWYGFPKLLISAEKGYWPPEGREAEYPEASSPWKFAHSPWCLDLRQEAPLGFGDLPDEADDQAHLHKLYLAKTPGIVLDDCCRVVQSIAHCAPWEQFFEIINGERVRNKYTGSDAIFTHANGHTTDDWVPIKEN